MAKRLLLIAGIFVAGLLAGWKVTSDHYEARKFRALQKEMQALHEQIKDERRINAGLTNQLSAERTGRQTDRATFERKIRDVKPQLVSVECPRTAEPRPADAAVPAVRFTADFVGLWNDGLGIGATAAERAGRTDGAPAASGLPDARDLLENLGRNAERWAECRSTVRGWQAWACSHGFAEPSQCK